MFKVGDRVAVYFIRSLLSGKRMRHPSDSLEEIGAARKEIGVIRDIQKDLVEIFLESDPPFAMAHIKQCRRLVKKSNLNKKSLFSTNLYNWFITKLIKKEKK